MATALFIVGVALAFLGFASQRVGIRSSTWKYTILGLALLSVVLGYFSTIDFDARLQQNQTETAEVQAQVNEIKRTRHMEPDEIDVLVAKVKPYAGQKFDMVVFRDQDSLNLARLIRFALQEAGWVREEVYPRHGEDYAYTHYDGVWFMDNSKENKTDQARRALQSALTDAGLYTGPDQDSHFQHIGCIELTGPLQPSASFTKIPCSESRVSIGEIGFDVHGNSIPEDVLVVYLGEKRL